MPDQRAGLPEAIRASARPRWSHRDPVEGGNPFPRDDPRRARWHTATARARAALAAHDARLARTAVVTLDPDRYREQMLDLAVARFDTWAERGTTVATDAATRRDFRRWLDRYVDAWLAYAADTCPRVEMRAALDRRLRARVEVWAAHAEAPPRTMSDPSPV